jgi:hypothetical protein
VSAFRTVSNLLLFLSIENGKWEMANEKSARSAPNRFERFTVFKPPALPEVSDWQMIIDKFFLLGLIQCATIYGRAT